MPQENLKEKIKLANYLKDNGQLDEAIAEYKKIIQLQPTRSDIYRKLGKLQAQKGNIVEAILHYTQLIRFNPNQSIKIYKELGNFLCQQGNLDLVLSIYRSIIDTQVTLKEAVHEYLGKAVVQLSIQNGQFDNMITFYKEALEIQPDNPWYFYYLGTAVDKQGKSRRAIKFYRKAIQSQEKFYLAYAPLGKILLKKGKLDEALQYGLKAIQIQPNFIEARDLCQKCFNRLHDRLSPEQLKEKEQYDRSVGVNHAQLKPRVLNTTGLILSKSECQEEIKFYQKAIYNKLQKLKPDFIHQYWEQSQLKNPNFLILGVMKCGTTSLYDYMIRHPKILPAILKETHCLKKVTKACLKDNPNWNFNLSDLQKNWVFSHFSPRPDEVNFITGEATPGNLFTPGLEKLVLNNFNDTKLIVIVRNPVKRAISGYYQRLKKGQETKSIEDVFVSQLEILECAQNLETFKDNYILNTRVTHSSLVTSLYVYYIEKWMNFFPREQFLILRTEDLSKDTQSIMSQVFEFLGIPDFQIPQYTRKNVKHYPPLRQDLYDRLSNFFKPHNQRLEEFLGRKFDWD